MFYIVALGNPGEKYARTRHNVGWLALDYCVESWQLPQPLETKAVSGFTTEGEVVSAAVSVLYPTTFMNNSGAAVAKMIDKKAARQLIVVHDEIDIPFGEIKVQVGRGPGGNNGVRSVIEKLGTKDFVRVRVGIAPRSFWTGKMKRPAGGGPLERFVLKPFTPAEQKQLPAVYQKVQTAIETILTDGAEAAMNRCN